jgi:hypothetical protein
LVFDDSICLGVVGRNVDVVDVILGSQPVQRSDVSSPVVGDKFLDCFPST